MGLEQHRVLTLSETKNLPKVTEILCKPVRAKKNKCFEFVKHVFFKSIAIVTFLALWEISPKLNWIDPAFVVPPSQILITIAEMWTSGDLLTHIAISFQRAIVGFGLAIIIAIPSGFLLGGYFKTVERVTSQLLQLLGQINPFSLFPVFILFFGIGETAKVAIIFWVSQWPILFNTITGVKGVDPLLVKSARSMGVSKFTLFWKIILPASLPTIFTGIRMSAGFSFFMLIAAEMLGSSAGLGYLIISAQANFQIANLYASTAIIAILGLFITNVFILIEKKLVTWKEQANAG